MRRFGGFLGSLVLALVGAGGCGIHYGFSQGSGLPPNIRTVAVLPFENQTPAPDITKELFDYMHSELQRRLGLRDAPSDRADAVVRGTIVAYDADVPIGFSADPAKALTARRRLALTVDIAIVDQSNGRVLYEQKGHRTEGEYAERAEADGRRQAIQRVVDDIVEGLQSQW